MRTRIVWQCVAAGGVLITAVIVGSEVKRSFAQEPVETTAPPKSIANAVGGEEGEVAVSLDQLPEAVMATILAEANGAVIEEIERETKNGRTVYEAEWIENGREVEVEVAADGTLIQRETDDDDDDDDDDGDDDDDDDDDD